MDEKTWIKWSKNNVSLDEIKKTLESAIALLHENKTYDFQLFIVERIETK